jgi:Cys-rich repeat protein
MRTFLSLLILIFPMVACSLATNEPLGSQCSNDANCESGFCSSAVDCPVKICACRVDSDCPSGKRCVSTIDCHPTCS